MSTVTLDLDTKRYGRLLARVLPAVVKSGEDNDRLLAAIEGLMAKGEDRLSPEEDALLELLVNLVHDYENRHDALPATAPHRMVAFLLNERRLAPSDLWPVLGSRGRVSEILSGKREISKSQAKKLAEFFHVGVALFI